MYSNIRYLEDKLSVLIGKNVTIKRQSFYIDEQFISYAKIVIDEEDTGMKVDFYDLTEYDRHGRLNHQLAKLANKLGESL